MKYTEIVVLLMKTLQGINGGLVGRSTTLAHVAKSMQQTDSGVTERLTEMAIKELLDHGLIQTKAIKTFGSGPKGAVYADLDLTGPGLRLLEGLEAQAVAEGKKSPWLWSMVEKAGTLANLISAVVQITRGG
jgi:hypothetical protein